MYYTIACPDCLYLVCPLVINIFIFFCLLKRLIFCLYIIFWLLFLNVFLDQLEPIVGLVSSWQKKEFECWPVLLDEVQDQYDMNAAKVS